MIKLPSVTPGLLIVVLLTLALAAVIACGGESRQSTGGTPIGPTNTPIVRDEPTATTAPAPTAAPTAMADETKAPASPASSVPSAKVGKFPDPSFALLKAPENNPQYGGTLRFGFIIKPAHFDVHQSGTALNMNTQGPMYDNLLRLHPLSVGREVIPDLAHSWDVSDDGKTYTFYLREGVKFHDGADLTSEDVKATFDRIIAPPDGVIIPRESVFKAAAVSEIWAPDPLTVEFVLSEARPEAFVLSAIASGWNIIVRKQTLEDNDFNLKRVKDYPGTGPFMFEDFSDQEFLKLERNPNYWNPELPYLDGIHMLHLNAWVPEMGAALLAGRVDYARAIEPGGFKKAIEHPEIETAQYPQHVIFAMWMNNSKEPMSDARVRRAMHLVLDREAIKQSTKDTYPAAFGAGFTFRFGKYATPEEELMQRPAYRYPKDEDIAEAQRLLAEAGYPNGEGIPELDFLVRQIAHLDLQAAAIQEMLRVHLNIKANIRSIHISQWFEDAEKGNFDLTLSAVVLAVKDPSDYFRAWYGKDGPQNYSLWENEEFEGMLNQIDRELDADKRLQLIRDAELLMEREVPLAPVAWEEITDAWWNYVKGNDPAHNVGIYDVVRWDTTWLDNPKNR